jgi:hypothetical protein
MTGASRQGLVLLTIPFLSLIIGEKAYIIDMDGRGEGNNN